LKTNTSTHEQLLYMELKVFICK